MKENHPLTDILYRLRDFFLIRLNINQEREDNYAVIEMIKQGVEFKGTNLWVLIFAILVACLGLNINSTAVIIGAMLISPLMGPIMGFGLGMGINDFELFKRSMRSYGVATLYAIIVSTLYFLISPVSDNQSELLARTQPTIYDVLIAFFGGCAGIIASCSKNKGNVIPGVAIATALMPPLCTVGYGIASGNWHYSLGAVYLYLINTVFIGLSTFFAIRLLKFPIKIQVNAERQSKISRIITLIVVCTIIPGAVITYRMIQTNMYETSANNFINRELDFPGTYIVNRDITQIKGEKTIHIVLVGKNVSDDLLLNAQSRLKDYHLEGVTLDIQQGVSNNEQDMTTLRSMVIQDFYEEAQATIYLQEIVLDSLRKQLKKYEDFDQLSVDLLPEFKALFPKVEQVSISRSWVVNVKTGEYEPSTMVYLHTSSPLTPEKREMMIDWLKARTDSKNLTLIEQ
ncbi:TIGR00341 family protein [Bacteroidales bacterium OttesenSCG-928-L03]|nr:TIGR00341 family protein [Bacteroidales bacterium OttesenSCG-928-L03]